LYSETRSLFGLNFELKLTAGSFGLDTSWELTDRNNDTVVVSNSSLASNQISLFTECFDPRGCYDFIIKDAKDDGICCQQGSGSYDVSIDGRLIASGGEFGSSESVYIGGSCGINPASKLFIRHQYYRVLVEIGRIL